MENWVTAFVHIVGLVHHLRNGELTDDDLKLISITVNKLMRHIDG